MTHLRVTHLSVSTLLDTTPTAPARAVDTTPSPDGLLVTGPTVRGFLDALRPDQAAAALAHLTSRQENQ